TTTPSRAHQRRRRIDERRAIERMTTRGVASDVPAKGRARGPPASRAGLAGVARARTSCAIALGGRPRGREDELGTDFSSRLGVMSRRGKRSRSVARARRSLLAALAACSVALGGVARADATHAPEPNAPRVEDPPVDGRFHYTTRVEP